MINKDKYAKAVKRLNIPDDLKISVLEELSEAFDSAKEHGETESDFIKRFGTPREFAGDVIKNVDLTHEQKKCIKKRKNIFKAVITFVIAAAAFTGYFIFRYISSSKIIGYADISTNIQVTGISGNILLISFYAAVFAVIAGLLIYRVYLKRKINEQ